jgi:hypothetical protein
MSEVDINQEQAIFDVFLSHNSQDKPLVRKLAKKLKDRNLRVWLDEEQLIPGRTWLDALEHTIETCRTAAVILGESGFGPWENVEMHSCILEFVKRKLPVIPVFLPSAPINQKLPLFLSNHAFVDLRKGFTQEGLDHLLWGITGNKPEKKKILKDRRIRVVIKADKPDQNIGQPVQELLVALNVQSTLAAEPRSDYPAGDNNKYFNDLLTTHDGVVIIYGLADPRWVQVQHSLASRAMAMRDQDIWGRILNVPPPPLPKKSNLGLSSLDLQQVEVMDCHESVSIDHVRDFISKLREGANRV